jgi:segregation and condensation protein A
LPELPIGETAQFILVASTLLLIKSRTLLPTLELTEDERESVQELERRLQRLQIIRAASAFLKRSWNQRPLLLAHKAPLRPAVFSPAEAAIPSILSAAERLLRVLPSPEKLAEAAVAPVIALEEVILQVKNRLTSAIRTRFSELTHSKDRHETIVYFLAMLELVRSGSASVTQERIFEDIEIELDGSSPIPRYGV